MNFDMIGKLSISKDTEKFHPYTEKEYDSGWVRKQLLFNAQCGDNRHMLTIQAGAFADGHGDVYSFTKSSVDENGNKVKGESIKIPFKDRLTSKRLPEIADWKKFVIDLDEPNRRHNLEKFAEKIKNGTSLTDDELKSVGLDSEDEVDEALKKSWKKYHSFISEWDYVDFVKKVIDSGKYDDRMFYIRGNGDYSYSEKNQRVYESYIPNRIYLAAKDAEPKSVATVKILFNEDSFDDGSVDEKGKYYISGYHMEYDSNRKGNIPVPITVSVPVPSDDADDKAKKFAKGVKRKFTTDSEEYKELGIDVVMINGAQKTEITDDMLSEEQLEDIEAGLLTKEDIIKDMGGSVYGERIREFQFLKIARGFSKGTEDTTYVPEDMVIKPIVNDSEDLFDDDDDEI